MGQLDMIFNRGRILFPSVSVCNITLQLSDGDGLESLHLVHDTGTLALGLLRADSAADSRQVIVLFQHLSGSLVVSFGDFFDESGDVDINRATLYT